VETGEYLPSHDEDLVDGEKLDPTEVIGPPRGLIERADAFLTEIEHAGPNLSPKDCVGLFDSIAELRFTDWGKVEILWTPERRLKVDATSRELYTRLRAQLDIHPRKLLETLETGIRELVGKVGAGLEHHAEIRRTYAEPWEHNPSYEFINDVIFPFDTLGYVLELMRDLSIVPGDGTRTSVRDLDRTMRLSLPEIAEEFRRGGDSIDPVAPDMYPESFWWMRLPGAKPIL